MAPVVVASDLSDHAAEALCFALRFRPAPFHLFHVHDISAPDGTTGHDVEAALADALDGIDDVTAVWRSALRPAEAIAAYVGEVGADLLVVGTHGRTGAQRFVIGSVAETLARTAPCDVLAVPFSASAPWSDRPTTRVLCAIDLSQGSRALADRAATLARRLGAGPPTVLHVEDRSASAAVRDAISGPLMLEAFDEELDVITNAHGTVATATGRAAPTIVGHADALDADLIIVGSHRRSGAARMLGSVASAVLRTAQRPVLVVHSSL